MIYGARPTITNGFQFIIVKIYQLRMLLELRLLISFPYVSNGYSISEYIAVVDTK